MSDPSVNKSRKKGRKGSGAGSSEVAAAFAASVAHPSVEGKIPTLPNAAANSTGLSDVELSPPSIRQNDEPYRLASPSAVDSGTRNFTSIDVLPSPPPVNTGSRTSYINRENPTPHSQTRLHMHAEGKEAAELSSAAEDPYLHTPHNQSGHSGELFERHIDFNDAVSARATHTEDGTLIASPFASNLVVTSRYTALNFIPVNLFEQFCELSNLYFLFVGFLQAIPSISTTQGIPTNYLPLAFILTVSAVRAAYEDYNRHVSDEIEGSKIYRVYDGYNRQFVTKKSKDIVVGDIIQMVTTHKTNDEEGNEFSMNDASTPSSVNYSSTFPADLLFLASSHEKGHCFVETSSLDGESSLKLKAAIPLTQHVLWTPPSIPSTGELDRHSRQNSKIAAMQIAHVRQLDLSVDIEAPNSKFDSCQGVLHMNNIPTDRNRSVPSSSSIALKSEYLLLRGTELRNTSSLLGLVVYTGADTKIRRNVSSTKQLRTKRSRLMERVNHLLLFMLGFQLLLCIFAGLLCYNWTSHSFDTAWYLDLMERPALAALRAFFSYYIICSQLVPISLLVSSELVKAAQAKFISWDLSMYDQRLQQSTVVRNSQLHEDLGQIEYVFTDKTGTMTANRMEFRVGFVGTIRFGNPESEIARRVADRLALQQQQQQHQAAQGPNSIVSPVIPLEVPWTERVSKLTQDQSTNQPIFDESERLRMLTALWGGKRRRSVSNPAPSAASSITNPIGLTESTPPADAKLSAEIRTFLTHMAISNTITPELRVKPSLASSSGFGTPSLTPPSVDDVARAGDYILNFSSPDELALCKFAAHMGFQFTSRSKDGVQLSINKFGYGDGESEVELYQSLATLDFNSKRKRVTCIYLRENQVHIMCKGADANVFPLLSATSIEAIEKRTTVETQLTEMATKGLRTLVIAGSVLPAEWWFGDGNNTSTNATSDPNSSSSSSSSSNRVGGMRSIYDRLNLPDRGNEKGHYRGECRSECRICAGLTHIELAANMQLLGATAIEDALQPLVPETISDLLTAGVKIWMCTGDKRETAKNIALACNLIDPDMESAADLLGSMDPADLNRVIEITGDWVSMTSKEDQLRMLFDVLDCGGDIVDGYRTGYISREELRLFLIGLRVPGMDDDLKFAAHWTLVENNHDGRVRYTISHKVTINHLFTACAHGLFWICLFVLSDILS
jgi:magnesium-transporting ATPase (P-type)